MKKLMKKDNSIIRILKNKDDKALIIDCIKRTMPIWVPMSELERYEECNDEELYKATGISIIDDLNGKEKCIAQQRFTMIAAILPFVGDEKERSAMIRKLAQEVSTQTIRKYLTLYLCYQDISVLAPARVKKRELSQDEKNCRWALNRFYYNKNKNSLKTAYTMMLKEKYCDELGKLKDDYPSYYQFRYYFRKTRKFSNALISREGKSKYQRDYRPLLGETQTLATGVGYAMLDSTICNVYLTDDFGNVVGRTILTACLDGFSGVCMGYSLAYQGGLYSLRNLMLNVVADKQEWCKTKGVHIEKGEWECNQMPGVLITDRGAEFSSYNFEQLAEIGCRIVNLPAFRPELKGVVEKFFDIINDYCKKFLQGKGYIDTTYRERGGHDYRLDARLNIAQFEQIILHSILFYNNKRIVNNFPYTEEMIEAKIEPFAHSIFEWGKKQEGANLIDVDVNSLIQVLLPRTKANFRRNGLCVNGLRYKNKNYTEDYLKGRECIVAYNPDDVSQIYLIENGNFIAFDLIETRFEGKSLQRVEELKEEKKKIIQNVQHKSLQAQIDLAENISVIANQQKHSDVGIKNIRETRKRERNRQHIDFTKVGDI